MENAFNSRTRMESSYDFPSDFSIVEQKYHRTKPVKTENSVQITLKYLPFCILQLGLSKDEV
jgi:hypothetical protein